MSTEVAAFQGPDFAGAASHQDGRIALVLSGNGDYAALDAVEMLLETVHEEAKRRGAGEVVVDLQRLEFMNSSCFKCFVTWITELQELAPAQQYKITFRSNPELHWQKRSLQSLRCFAVELITLTDA